MSDASGERRRGPEQDPTPPPGRDRGPSSPKTPTRPGTHIIRPMPSGDRGGTFEDLARRSALERAEDPSRFEAPEEPDGRRGLLHALPLRTLVTLAVAMLALGVAAGVLWVNVFGTGSTDGATIVTPTGDLQEKYSSPRETVLGYLQALADGRAEDALAFGPPLSTEHSTLLLEQSSLDAMPIASRPSNIRVLTKDPLATEVSVEYTLSGELVSTTMRTERQGDDSYRLERTTVTIQLQVAGSENLPVLLNGVAIDPSLSLSVLPGTYRPSTGLALIDFLDVGPLEISSLADADIVVFPVNPELTPAGRTAFEQAARSSLESCISSNEPAPTGCPNVVRPPKEVVPGGVAWELLEPDTVWKSFNPTLSPEDQTTATATLSMQLTVTMDFTAGQSSAIDNIFLNVPVSATMVGEDPTSISVVWGG